MRYEPAALVYFLLWGALYLSGYPRLSILAGVLGWAAWNTAADRANKFPLLWWAGRTRWR